MKKLLLTFLMLLSFSSFMIPAYAITGGNNLKNETFDVQNYLDLDPDSDDEQSFSYFKDPENPPIISFLISVLNFAALVIGSVALLMMVIAGLLMMVAEGDETRLNNAKEMFKFTIIGLLIAFMSYIIVIFVQSIFIPGDVENRPSSEGTEETTES